MKKKLAVLGLGAALLLSGCASRPSEDLKLNFLDEKGNVTKSIKIDDYEIYERGSTVYEVGDKSYEINFVPHQIEGTRKAKKDD